MDLSGNTLVAALVVTALIGCSAGVPKDSVIKEADVIDRNAQMAQALHDLCLDGGAASEPCADEAKKIQNIRESAKTLQDISK